MNNYNSLSLGFSSYLKKWSSNSAGSPPTITVHEKQKMTPSFGVMSFMFFALVFLGLFSSNAIAQTTIISGTGAGSFESADLSTDGWSTSQTATNAWVTGAAAGATHGTNAAYINTTGTPGGAVSYLNTSSQANHIYRDFTYPVGEDIGTITFDLKGAPADIGFDRITVYVCATTVFPVAGTEAPVGTVQIF